MLTIPYHLPSNVQSCIFCDDEILVIVEDALGGEVIGNIPTPWEVLILVIVEGVLGVQIHFLRLGLVSRSLNPCYSGRCSRSSKRMELILQVEPVLILVILEDALGET